MPGRVRFILGRAGSGKSRHCFDSIVSMLREDPLGRPILWIVPRQATFVTERQLTCESELGGYCRAQVLSFDRLARDILLECGGAAVPEITPLGRRMILGHLLRRHEAELTFFSKVARHAGTAERLDGTLAEFERCGKDPQALSELLSQVSDQSGGGESLAAKLHDLHLLFASYQSFLGQDRLDPARRMQQVLACVERSTRLAGATVFVDGFSEFEDLQSRMLARLARVCESVEVALLVDGASVALNRPDLAEELSLFHRTERAYGRLAKVLGDEDVAVDRPVVLREIRRFTSPAFQHIERELFSEHSAADEVSAEGVELAEAADRRAEVEAAARRVRRLTADGLRLRDIAVMVRRIEPYHDLIAGTFHEHGIPHFIDRRRTMAHHPLLQMLRAMLAIVQNAWANDAVMDLLKCGLAQVSADDAAELENYVLLHRLRPAAWTAAEPWTYCRRSRQDETATAQQQAEYQRMDALRRQVVEKMSSVTSLFTSPVAGVGDPGSSLPASPRPATAVIVPVRQIAPAIFQTLDAFNVPATLANWIDADRAALRHADAGEHEQVWAGVVDLFDQMVDLLGDEPMTLADFAEVLQSALEGFDLALAPPTIDQVIIGQVDRTRINEARAILLLGMNEGEFPAIAGDRTIISDTERQELARRQFEIDPGTERRLLDENLLGYVAFTRATERLYVSRFCADDAGRPSAPSPFWRRVRELFPKLVPAVLSRDPQRDATCIGTPRQLLAALMSWVRDGGTIDQTQPWPALYQFLASHGNAGDALDLARQRAWRALGYANDAHLSREIAQRLFSSPLPAGVRQIETFAACPFKHFLTYGPGLEEREEADPTGADLGAVYHRILERLARQLLRQRADWNSLPAGQQKQLIKLYCQQIGQSLRGELMLSTARNRYLLDRIERNVDDVVNSQRVIAEHSRFRTAYASVAFGETGEQLPPLVVATPAGREVHLSGRIDRVDVLEQQAAFAVIDYRLSHGRLALDEVYHGLSLQLLVYLLVLEAHGESLAGRKLTPAAAFYVRLLSQLERVAHPDDAPSPDDPSFALMGKMRGIFDGQFAREFDGQFTDRSDVISAVMNKDGNWRKDQTDLADAAELRSLLERVRGTIADIGDRIFDGCVDVRPYRKVKITPCAHCSFKSVCRFDNILNDYRHIDPIKRQEVLARLGQEAGHA